MTKQKFKNARKVRISSVRTEEKKQRLTNVLPTRLNAIQFVSSCLIQCPSLLQFCTFTSCGGLISAGTCTRAQMAAQEREKLDSSREGSEKKDDGQDGGQ